jgi:EmrB/QacA subfamily drug resistance transporter
MPVRMGLVVACSAQFLVGVDGLAVAIALPAIRETFGAEPSQAQWVLTAYALCFGGGLLLAGRLGDLYGRRRLLVCGLLLFAGGSLVAVLAPVLAVLVGARAAQGAGAAAAVPASLALIGSVVPAGRERTHALGLLAGMASLGVLAGMLLGGAIVTALGWRWVFGLLSIPALVTALAAPAVLPEARGTDGPRRLDGMGAALVTLGLLAVLLGLTRTERDGFAAPAVLGPLAVGLVLLAAFAAWERRAPAPLIRLELLRVRSLRAATVAVGLNAIGFTAVVFVGTLYLQEGLGYSAWEAGLAALPIDVVSFAVSLAARDLVARHAPRRLLVISFAVSGLALAWLARAPEPARYVTDFMAPLVLLGASMCTVFMVTTRLAVADVAPDDKGLASGVFETANHLFGGAIGVALYATLIAAGGYQAAFATAAALAALGALTARG